MLQTRIIRALNLIAPAPAAGGLHLSAASGLVQIGEQVYVVADDELALGRFGLCGDAPGDLLTLFDGALPATHAARKAAKPDLEALALLPAFAACPFGALMAFGSGSRANRQQSVLLARQRNGELDGPPRQIDLAPLFEPLRRSVADLNIEGAFVAAGSLCLLQRGNARAGVNAVIRFGFDGFAAWLQGSAPAPKAAITRFDLGQLDAVPLGFTDGAPLSDGGWVFSAAAEETLDPYDDGRCAGSVVGIVDAAGAIHRIERMAGTHKVEGITATAEGAVLQLLMVTDADDRQAPALLLSATLEPTP